MDGAQQIGGLWRLYPKSRNARDKLLVGGIVLRNIQIRLHDENPFLVGNKLGDDQFETSKIFISNVPISFYNREIEGALTNLGCKLVSRMIDECDRDDSGKLTHWKTGRRFVHVAKLKTPLADRVHIGMFVARIYHREQKNNSDPFCSNCLTKGHRKFECVAEVVCRTCRKSGHKSGAVLCMPRATITESDVREITHTLVTSDIHTAESESENEVDDHNGEADLSSSSESTDMKVRIAEKKRKAEEKGDGSKNESSEEGDENRTPTRDAKLSRPRGASAEPEVANSDTGGS